MAERSSKPVGRDKAALRQWAKERRAALAARLGDTAPLQAAAAFAQAISVTEGQVVAGYWPHLTEISPLPILEWCAGVGAECALPVMRGRGHALLFRRWRPAESLITGAFGIREPRGSAPQVTPTLVVTPLLAFDRAGHRLGYGQGFYDKTLTALRREDKVRCVGLAYAGQEVEELLPAAPHDQALDWIVTERGAYRVAG